MRVESGQSKDLDLVIGKRCVSDLETSDSVLWGIIIPNL